MKSKNIIFLMFIFALLCLSMVNLNFNGVRFQNSNIIHGGSNQNEFEYSHLKISETSNINQVDVAESAARWLNNTWTNNKWNESGNLYLGQKGVAGIGDFFIELSKATSNNSYLTWAQNVGDWLIANRPGNYENGKWPSQLGSPSYIEINNYTGYEQGAAGIGSFSSIFIMNQA